MKTAIYSGAAIAMLLTGCGGGGNSCQEPVIVNKFTVIARDMDTGDVICNVKTGQDDIVEGLEPYQDCTITIDDEPASQIADVHVAKTGYVTETIESVSYSLDSCGRGKAQSDIEVYLEKR